MAVEHPLMARIAPIHGETPRRILRTSFYLPAIMRGFGWGTSFAHTEYTTLRDGEFSQPALGGRGAPDLTTVDDMESLTVVWNPEWLAAPEEVWGSVRTRLERIGEAKVPFELMVKPRHLRNNVAQRETLLLLVNVTMRSLHVEMREGEPDTLYFTIGLREWRKAGVLRLGAGKAQDAQSHVLDDDDTLNSLAMKYFHSYGAADAIARANSITNWGRDTPLKKHPRFKRRGAKVKIPSIPRTTGLRPVPGSTPKAAFEVQNA